MSLNGECIDNNSYVDIDRIGTDETGALLCHTNRTDCGSSSTWFESVEGDWYYPNGAVVRMAMTDNNTTGNVSTAPFISNRTQGGILLFQNMDSYSATERGRFGCVIPCDNDTVNQTLYVNICELATCLQHSINSFHLKFDYHTIRSNPCRESIQIELFPKGVPIPPIH